MNTPPPRPDSLQGRIERKLLGRLFEEHRTWLLNSILARTGDMDTAHDILQETFLRAQRAATRLNLSAGSGPYLQRIAHNLVARHLRVRQNVLLSENLDRQPADTRLLDSRSPIRDALESLPENQRRVAELRYYEDCGYNEVSARLGISVRTAKRRMQEAKTSLKRRLI